MLQNWLTGVNLVFSPDALLLLLGGVVFGLVFGAIPGLTAALGVILLIPITYSMSATTGLATLVGIYVGGISGGLVSATLLGMPGTPSSIATTFDGFPLAKKGRAGQALGFGTTASLIGGVLSGFAMILLSPFLARFALTFSAFEYSALFLFGLTVVISLSGKALKKGLVAAAFGLGLAVIGMDPVGGLVRNNLGLDFLEAGVSFFPVLMGLFVMSEVFIELYDIAESHIIAAPKIEHIWPTLKDLQRSWFNFIRSSLIGIGIGILPGIGPALSNFVAYDQAKKASKHPETFGEGNLDGIIASEAANNATVGGAMIPLLTLGIPGDAVTAALLGGFIIHGIRPGPLLFQDNPEIVYSIFVAYFLAVVAMFLVMMLGGVKLFARALRLPKYILLPLVVVMCFAGVYNIDYRIFDIWLVLIFGVIGFFMRRGGYPLVPAIIGLILGPMFELQFRTALSLSKGSFLPFFTRPISVILIVLSAASVAFSLYMMRKGEMFGQKTATKK